MKSLTARGIRAAICQRPAGREWLTMDIPDMACFGNWRLYLQLETPFNRLPDINDHAHEVQQNVQGVQRLNTTNKPVGFLWVVLQTPLTSRSHVNKGSFPKRCLKEETQKRLGQEKNSCHKKIRRSQHLRCRTWQGRAERWKSSWQTTGVAEGRKEGHPNLRRVADQSGCWE